MSKLKLIALDDSDLAVISTHVQDALTRPDSLDFSARTKRFSLGLNRFAWDASEGAAKRGSRYERRQSVLSFSRVEGVQTRGIKRSDASQVLSLMAVHFVRSDSPAGTVELIFADFWKI